MTEQEIKEKSLEFVLRCLEMKLKNDQTVYTFNALINDVLASAKKIEEYLRG